MDLKEIFRKNKLSIIMSIVTLLIGIILYYSMGIGLPFKEGLIVFLSSFLPFFVFLIITIVFCCFKEKVKKVFKIISIILCPMLLFYYFITLFLCLALSSMHPITDIKYYNHYVSGELLKVFPKKIPKDVKNVEFYHSTGFLQGGVDYYLYYIDEDMTKEEFNDKYKDMAIWIGYKDEYTEKDGLFAGLFTYMTDYENENDYLIYLIEGNCDSSGYCNHGNLLAVAFNEKTNEVIFRSGTW